MNSITIAAYKSWHQQHFEKLNRQWIEKYFEMEPLDEFILGNPAEAILKPGGAILMAYWQGIIAGTVALIKVDNKTYEFAKMAVNERFRRKGIAEALSYAAFQKAKELGAEILVLHTNSILKPAIHLYEKLGFKRLPPGAGEYKRVDIKMTIDLSNPDLQNYIWRKELTEG